MSEWEFLHTSPKSFYARLDGFKELTDIYIKSSWEQTRFITLAIMNTAGKSVKKELKPKDLILFEWEKTISLDRKQIEADKERFEHLKKKWHNPE